MRSQLGWYAQNEMNCSDGRSHIDAMLHRPALEVMKRNSVSLGWTPILLWANYADIRQGPCGLSAISGHSITELTILILTRNHVSLWSWISEVLHIMRSQLGWYAQYEMNCSDGRSHIDAMLHRPALEVMKRNSVSLGWTPLLLWANYASFLLPGLELIKYSL